MDCCYEEAAPLPAKVAILDPKALPSSVNIDSPVPGGSRISGNDDNNYGFSFQVHADNLALADSWKKDRGSLRKFCSTPNIPEAYDPMLEDNPDNHARMGLCSKKHED